MASRLGIVVGIGVISGALAVWLVARHRGSETTSDGTSDFDTGSAGPSAGRDGGAQIAAPPTPDLDTARGAHPALPATPTPAQEFASQTRDADWASPTETEIKKRWQQIRGGALEDVECHQSQCKLTIVGSQRDVGRSIADLEGAHGLHGFAKSLYLSGPEKKPDGTIVLRAYASFERSN